MTKRITKPSYFLVLDDDGEVQYSSTYRDACHEHINDAINEFDMLEAAFWRVVECFPAPEGGHHPVGFISERTLTYLKRNPEAIDSYGISAQQLISKDFGVYLSPFVNVA